MPTTLDIRMVPLVLRLLAQYGRDATFAQPSTYAYTPLSGVGAASFGAPVTTKVTPPEGYSTFFTDGDLIKVTDLKVYVGVRKVDYSNIFTVTPFAGLTVTIDGTVYTIESVGNIASGEFIVLHEIQLRR